MTHEQKQYRIDLCLALTKRRQLNSVLLDACIEATDTKELAILMFDEVYCEEIKPEIQIYVDCTKLFEDRLKEMQSCG